MGQHISSLMASTFLIITTMITLYAPNHGAALSLDSSYNLNPMIGSNAVNSKLILKTSLKSAMIRVQSASQRFAINGPIEKLIASRTLGNSLAQSALQSCRELLSLAMHNLNSSFSSANQENIKTLLCAAGSHMQTCLNGFDDLVLEVRDHVYKELKSSIDETRNSRGLIESHSSNRDSYRDPYWLPFKDRAVLLDSNINANVVVAKDGSGNYSSISDALNVVRNCSNERFVIYVKKGVYLENVKIEKDQWNVMMFGDGMNETVVSGNLSYGGGKLTYYTATFAVLGQGFIARDMGFLNTAGPANQQAVALLSAADQSVFYRCRIDAYQDTLYAHSHRQFYRECHISGTIDFIFGDAAVVIQNSTILVKKPLPGQQNTITAHQRTDPRCQTGIVVQSCTIQPVEDLSGVTTYLGRPWSDFSTVVFMENYMQGFIDPRGWMPWKADAAPPDTVFLAEFENEGEGAGTAERVRWNGVRVNLSSEEASMYTVHSLINGDQWLPKANVSYNLGL